MNDPEIASNEIDKAAQELQKIDKMVEEKWGELYSEFPKGAHSSPEFLTGWNRIHAYREVWTDIAMEVPLTGRLASVAVDARTTVRVIESVLERQVRLEAKIDQLFGYIRVVLPLMVAMLVLLAVPYFV